MIKVLTLNILKWKWKKTNNSKVVLFTMNRQVTHHYHLNYVKTTQNFKDNSKTSHNNMMQNFK